MNNQEIISRAISYNNSEINAVKSYTNVLSKNLQEKEGKIIELNTDALEGLVLPGDVSYPEFDTNILLNLFGFDNVLALYNAIPTFDNKIFVLKPTLEPFSIGSTSYIITNCTPCIGKVVPYGTTKILMLTFVFNTANGQMGIITLYVDSISSNSVRGRIGLEEIPDSLPTKFSYIENNYVKKDELNAEIGGLATRLTTVENYTVPDARANVLWIGTSIPAGDIQHGNNGTTQSTTTDLGSNNYPKMVADALGFNLYNNARGSSFVCFYPPNEDGTENWAGKDWSEYSSEVWKGYSLSASFAQVDEKFGPNGLNCPQWLINNFKSYSYESLIIPYIDGTLASCDTVVIDHGYNDRKVIINEASWHPGEGETQFAVGAGRDWLLKLQDPFETTLETEGYFQGKWWNDESVSSKKHYMSAIIFLVKKIWEVNPRIKIIIGNYFTSKSNVFGSEFGNDRLGEFVHLANSAIASWLRVNCVEVWHHTGIYNRNVGGVNDYQNFCPDGVHPHSDSTGLSNKIIAGVYINAIRGTLYI